MSVLRSISRFGLAALLALASAALARAALPQRAYVWQRAWTPAVRAAVAETGNSFTALDVLVAEIAWRNGQVVTTPVTPDWAALRAHARSVALVVRVGPTAAAWAPDSPATRGVVAACTQALARARAAGIEPAELQLDFDAATSRLAAYRDLLRAVRAAVRPPRLTLTTLPDWLRSADFATLVAEADGFTLQVHSLEKPATLAAPFTLCDPAKARTWVARAAALGRPFRVALPAYGYRLIFDGAGKFTALEAEGEPRDWPAGYTTRLAIADAAEISALAGELLASPPPHCEGIAWFRLPIAGDELAWSWPTLRAVLRGEIPRARLALLASPAASGVLELTLTNTGDAAAEPAAFRLEWRDALALAADGLAGWQVERAGPTTLLVRPPPHGSNGLLRPGQTLRVGWLRLDRAAEVTAFLLP